MVLLFLYIVIFIQATETTNMVDKLTEKQITDIAKNVVKNVVEKDVMQVLYVLKLEDLCYKLKRAIINKEYMLPEKISFERYLHKLMKVDDIIYTMNLLHECWLYAYPAFHFDCQPKDTMPQEDMLDKALNKFKHIGSSDDEGGDRSNDVKVSDYDFVKNEIDKHKIVASHIINYNKFVRLPKERKEECLDYLDSLWKTAKVVCKKKKIKIGTGFIINYSLIIPLSPNQIKAVFNAVSQKGCMNGDNDTGATFLAMFNQTTNAVENKIMWLETTKSKAPNYAMLYTMFETMGVKMTEFEKIIICRFIRTTEGDIKPEQLKTRKSNQSKQLKDFECMIKDAVKQSP